MTISYVWLDDTTRYFFQAAPPGQFDEKNHNPASIASSLGGNASRNMRICDSTFP